MRGAMILAVRCAILALALSSSHAHAQANADVDLALLLAVDCSGSVDDREYALSMLGIASAFRDPEIIETIARWAPNGVAASVVHWSSYHWEQVAIVDWTAIGDRASAEALATRIETTKRSFSGDTSLGGMFRFAINHLENERFENARRVIDVSGDGEPSSGDSPDRLRDAAVAGSPSTASPS